MITKNNIISGGICGIICVIFMWAYMFFAHKSMNMQSMNMQNKMHMMPDGSMMMNDMMDMTMNDMVKMMDGKSGAEMEKAFLEGMIPHHQGAVDMAKKLLEDRSIRPEMKKFAEDIIKAQTAEIEMQRNWLKIWFNK
jgi:uncharacterized protein (DUF305 family)